MHVYEAFDIFQGKVDADANHVRKARHRRDIFSDAFKKLEDVKQVIPSGSLARGTQLDPIHDVDLIVVFDENAHPDWGKAGSSAKAALTYVQAQVRMLLGYDSSPFQQVVGETLLRNHVVKCFLDPRFLAEDKDFKSSFAVEVMPALRSDGTLLVPAQKKDSWERTDPEYLIREVRLRQEQWPYFIRMVRVVKFWMRYVDSGVKPLAAEVLALNCLPGISTSDSPRSVALKRFFTAASPAVMVAVKDPAGHCGEIQPDLRRVHVSGLLKEAADIAANAVAWEQQGEEHKAICCWRAVFGDDFPMPPGGCPGSGGGSGGDEDGGNGGQPRGPRTQRDADEPDPSTGPYPSNGGTHDPHTGDGDTPEGSSGDRERRRLGFPPFVPGSTPPTHPVKDAPQG
jgi:hypothetical protein